MSLSMYQASVPAFVEMLNNLSAILDKARPMPGTARLIQRSYSIPACP